MKKVPDCPHKLEMAHDEINRLRAHTQKMLETWHLFRAGYVAKIGTLAKEVEEAKKEIEKLKEKPGDQ